MRSLVSIVEKNKVVRASLYRFGIQPEALSRALQLGLLLKIGGLYARRLPANVSLYCLPHRLSTMVNQIALLINRCLPAILAGK
jgi:hypothetical protein